MAAISVALLEIRVNLDAFIAEPASYLQAVFWRICGKKLRARHRFAALKGATSRAYDLWQATREVRRLSALVNRPGSAETTFVIVIDCRTSPEGVMHSIASVRHQSSGKACKIVLLGFAKPVERGVVCASTIEDLKAWLEEFCSQTQEAKWHVLAMDAGDLLSPVTLTAYANAIDAHPHAQLLYADDDLIDCNNRRHSPHFKPQWNSELFQHHDFISGSCVFACDTAKIGHDWPRGALPFAETPIHLPFVLHHRRSRLQPVRPVTIRSAQELPHVSIIVPTRNAVDLMRTCMAGLAATDYPSFDITVIDNESDDVEARDFLDQLRSNGMRVLSYPGPFNYAAMHNEFVPRLAGPFVCLLNNDIEITNPDWLRIMAQQCQREEVGAVGAKLLYPDGTIQHAGIVTGVGGGAGHAHRFQSADAEGYFDRVNLPQFISAVTAACLLVRKDRFLAVGGFDASHFTVAFNDVDLCLKLNQRGWQSFYEPRARLIHHESKSRGVDSSEQKRARFAGELAALKRIWGTDKRHDQFHHPELSQYGERFVVRL